MSQKWFCAAALALCTAFAAAADYSPSYTVLTSRASYDVNRDGSYTEEVSEDLRLNNQAGVDDLSQYAIQFSSGLQSVRVLEAWTVTREGRRLPVSRAHMLLQQSSESADAPMFDDSKVLNVVFPALAPGATIHIRFRRTQRVPVFPGVFALQQSFSLNEDRRSTGLTVRLPAGMRLQVESLGVQGGEVASDRAGYRVWHWEAGRNVARAPESDAVSDVDYSPRVAVSTLSSYDELARAYRQRAAPRAAVTPYLRRLAAEITAGVDDPRAQAEALYRWVSKNIRYVAIYFGVGGVVPHAADAVAHALYGDCKDHVTLYQALLAAKGIDSSPVLVNADQSWWLSRVAVPTGSFNHAINYLPRWNLFVDTTAQFAPFGVLPNDEAGKQALVIDDGSGKSRLMTLPLSSPQRDRVTVDARLQLRPDGSLVGASAVATAGVYDFLSRSAFSGVTPGTEGDAAGKLLSARGLQGSGMLKLGNAYDLTRPFAYQAEYELPDYVDLSGPTALVLPAGADSIAGIAAFAAWGGAQPVRHFPTVLDNGEFVETSTLTLPSGVTVLALPRAVDADSPFGRYRASYRLQAGVISVSRRLLLSGNPPVLTPERYPAFYRFARAVAHDLRAQILLKPAD